MMPATVTVLDTPLTHEAFLMQRRARMLRKVIGRKPTGTPMIVAVLGGDYLALGLVRAVKHRDHTRSYALTAKGRLFLETHE